MTSHLNKLKFGYNPIPQIALTETYSQEQRDRDVLMNPATPPNVQRQASTDLLVKSEQAAYLNAQVAAQKVLDKKADDKRIADQKEDDKESAKKEVDKIEADKKTRAEEEKSALVTVPTST